MVIDSNDKRIENTPSSFSPLLDVQHLHAWYGGAHILFDVNLQVGRGEVVALMGRNGAGKSTTLKSIMGLVDKTQGAVLFRGQSIQGLAPYKIARLGLGYVPEDRRIFAALSVDENLFTGRQAPRMWEDGTPAASWTPEQLFTLFPNLAKMRQRPGTKMSGGEQQMLSVARTLMGNPYLVLLDEPSEGVAPVIVDQMKTMVLQLKAQGVGVLLSEQNLDFVLAVADSAYILEKGEVKYYGSITALKADRTLAQQYLAV
ncbi:ABC transporter ATP-binding protein [Pelistega europaea]|uniref:ABC transporter ATP-binding protein n=1 Tax=Pelistega europaea TaxID=106147 RepID=A0A7Y4L7S8_9BURK|nr:ABC transporter ATP-binding protein [Pelistega europaea]NOL48559.1 ABC transporter ATP-binding protein [Pelistega europaea]